MISLWDNRRDVLLTSGVVPASMVRRDAERISQLLKKAYEKALVPLKHIVCPNHEKFVVLRGNSKL